MLELGGYVGYSAIKFGDAVRKAGGKRYISLELNPINAAVAKLLIELAGLQDIVSVIVAPAYLSIAQLVQDGVLDSVEMLFIDHWKDRYVPDLWLVERLGLLRAGQSVVIADNISLASGRGTDYVEWLQASSADKKTILARQTFGDGVDGVDLGRLVKERGVKNGVDLENVPGNPSIVYETQLHEFEGQSGRTVSDSGWPRCEFC